MAADMDANTWYILPNGNIKHLCGLEIQPEQDWFPTEGSLEVYTKVQQGLGKTEVQVIQSVMRLALECEQWVKDNVG